MGVMDNAGRYSTGSIRGGAMLYADSLFGHRDRMSLGSYFSKGAQSPFFDYNVPVNKMTDVLDLCSHLLLRTSNTDL